MTAGQVPDAPDITVALATMVHMPSGMADTPALSAALAGNGVSAQALAWDDSSTDWRQFSLVVPHCTWDYLERQLPTCTSVSALLPISVSPSRWPLGPGAR